MSDDLSGVDADLSGVKDDMPGSDDDLSGLLYTCISVRCLKVLSCASC